MGEHMSTAPLAHTDVIVLDYLAALWAQSDDLSPELRDELMSAVADYVAARRTAPGQRIDDPNAIISRLGPPEALVEATARRGQVPPHIRLPALVPPPAPALAPLPPRHPPAGGPAEFTAVGLLTAGAFVLPVVSPIAGMLLATASPHWTPAQKAAGWVTATGSVVAGAVLTLMFAAVGATGEAALLFAYLAMTAGSVVAGVLMLNGLRNRGQAG
jgi:hypothetical protein